MSKNIKRKKTILWRQIFFILTFSTKSFDEINSTSRPKTIDDQIDDNMDMIHPTKVMYNMIFWFNFRKVIPSSWKRSDNEFKERSATWFIINTNCICISYVILLLLELYYGNAYYFVLTLLHILSSSKIRAGNNQRVSLGLRVFLPIQPQGHVQHYVFQSIMDICFV